MMNLPSLNEITNKAINAFKRFPVTLVWAICGTLYVIQLLNDTSTPTSEEQTKVFLTLVLGISWLISTRFFIERFKNPKKWIWLKLVVLAFLFLFYWHLPDTDIFSGSTKYFIRFFHFFIAGHLFLFFAPFIGRWNKTAYWNYLKSVGIAIVRSVLFSHVLYLGLALALAAVDALFDMDIDGKRYGQLFVLCIGIVNTWIYLSDFPKNILEETPIRFNKALEVFVKFILIPLVLLYITILYAYGSKILVQWELPKGWVSYLVTALALLGLVVQVIINPVQKTIKSWTINKFYPWFYQLLLPLVVLLFVAIFRRIGDYGVTENRYFVLVIALWILGITVYLLLSKKKSLKILPISLFILALVSSFGPWGVFSVSKNSQIRQFEKVYDAVKENNRQATVRQYKQLGSILDYLDDRKSVFELDHITGMSIKEIFKDTIASDKSETYGWFDTKRVLDSLGVTLNPNENNNTLRGNYSSYYINQEQVSSYDIASYQYMTEVSLSNYTPKKTRIGKFELYYNSVNLTLELLSHENGNICIEVPIKDKLKKALTKYGDNLYEAEEEELTIISKNDSLTVKLIFTDLGLNIKNDSIIINHLRAFLFLKQN